MAFPKKEPHATPVGVPAGSRRETQPETGFGSADDGFMAPDDKRLTKI